MMIKTFSLAALACLAAGIAAAQPQPIAVTTHYSALNIAMVATVNSGKMSGSTYKFTSTKVKLANKDILKLLADANGAPWPAGAKLEFDWDSGQVIVAEKNGTNILLYASYGINRDDILAWLDVEWVSGQGAVEGSHSYQNPGADNLTFHNEGRMRLFYMDSVNQIDLWATGENTRKITQKWNSFGGYTTWTDSESCPVFGAGLTYLNMGDVSVKGTMKASGSGQGGIPGGYVAEAPAPPGSGDWRSGGLTLTDPSGFAPVQPILGITNPPSPTPPAEDVSGQ